MADTQISTKRLQISKANTQVVVVIAIAAFVTTFSLVASHALLSKRSYQSRVITEKEKAVDQLRKNTEEVTALAASYQEFVNRAVNVLDGNPSGDGDRDGDNAKIILDALPSKYDFPALTSSIEKLLQRQNMAIENIVGTDDEVAQLETGDNPNPEPVEMPFEFSVAGKYGDIQKLLSELERSIRPFHITRLEYTGSDDRLTLSVNAKTYYLPAKTLSIIKKVVE